MAAPAIDPNDRTWRLLQARIAERVEADRTTLATHGMGVAETEFLRGRIAALSELLALAEPAAPTPFDRPLY